MRTALLGAATVAALAAGTLATTSVLGSALLCEAMQTNIFPRVFKVG